ncbi:MAG: hypothetical protein JSS83_21985 [Cyanobacteria bacterium SZAS LIN-3]|nr:hypothetical protein [Cyanobacteria bacterium SZAS LIN-3]
MLSVDCQRIKLSGPRSSVRIDTSPSPLPIEVIVTAKLPPGAGKWFVDNALAQQEKHPEYIDEYNEPSALIGRTTFEHSDPTAVYTFGVDKRDLVFHRHQGHRIITGITGGKGCLLKFSLCTPEDARENPRKFLENLYIVTIPGDRQFVLRFSGTVYHQFCPADKGENAFFAVSTHTNEAWGLTGEVLQTVLANNGTIALLTEPAPPEALELAADQESLKQAVYIDLDIE